jgi:hypothetical protein
MPPAAWAPTIFLKLAEPSLSNRAKEIFRISGQAVTCYLAEAGSRALKIITV